MERGEGETEPVRDGLLGGRRVLRGRGFSEPSPETGVGERSMVIESEGP